MAIIALHSTQQFIPRVIKYGILIEIILSSQSWLLKARIYLKVVVNVIHLELLLARVFTDLQQVKARKMLVRNTHILDIF